MSTLLSIYSISQIFTTTKHLSATNDNIRTNQKTLVVHSVLLALNCFVTIVYNFPYGWAPKLSLITNALVPFADLIVQLFICHICWTLGASEDLNRFDFYLIENGLGGYELKFVLKESVPEAVGVPHASDDASD